MADACELHRFRRTIVDDARRAIEQSHQLKARTDKVVAISRRLEREAPVTDPEPPPKPARREP